MVAQHAAWGVFISTELGLAQLVAGMLMQASSVPRIERTAANADLCRRV